MEPCEKGFAGAPASSEQLGKDVHQFSLSLQGFRGRWKVHAVHVCYVKDSSQAQGHIVSAASMWDATGAVQCFA